MSRAINVNATQEHVLATCTKHKATISVIESLHSGGTRVVFTYGQAPLVNGARLDYSKWKLFESPYLNAEKGSRRITISYGRMLRVLDFSVPSITESATPTP